MNWNDLGYLLAIMRGTSLTRAARLMGVDKSTVSRRLAALEADMNIALIERAADGKIALTDAGRMVAHRAEAIEDEIREMTSDLGQGSAIAARVRLTAVPMVVNHLLLPQVPALIGGNPNLALELIADARDLNLLDHDADIALRLARPRGSGQGVIARRVGVLEYRCFAAIGAPSNLPWIGYEPRMQFLDHAVAIERLAARPGQIRGPLSVNDAETLLLAVTAGHGKTLLPRQIARQTKGVQELDWPDEHLPTRDVWLLVRRDLRDLERIRRVIDWIEAVLKTSSASH